MGFLFPRGAPSSLESAEWKQKRSHEAELHGAFLGLILF
jgi:hypothetical protein